jgi:hypothetical protein
MRGPVADYGRRGKGSSTALRCFGAAPPYPRLYQVDFDPPLYNVWKYTENATYSEHCGNSNMKRVDNLLYLYT